MANIATKFGLSAGGGFDGAATPIPPSGMGALFPPTWGVIVPTSGTLNTTAGRLYYIPFYFPALVQFTGLKMRNLGAGDNGEVLRLGVYEASQTTGLPSTLVIDAGEITLTGAAADRTLAAAWTPPYVGWGYFAYHANTAADIMPITDQLSSSQAVFYRPARFFGLSSTTPSTTAANFGGYYVDTAYAALASTAVAPTNVTNLTPAVFAYRT